MRLRGQKKRKHTRKMIEFRSMQKEYFKRRNIKYNDFLPRYKTRWKYYQKRNKIEEFCEYETMLYMQNT